MKDWDISVEPDASLKAWRAECYLKDGESFSFFEVRKYYDGTTVVYFGHLWIDDRPVYQVGIPLDSWISLLKEAPQFKKGTKLALAALKEKER